MSLASPILSISAREVDAKTLAEGRHYRVCLELEESSPLGGFGADI